jgi:hypothetical protein
VAAAAAAVAAADGGCWSTTYLVRRDAGSGAGLGGVLIDSEVG